MSKQTQIKFSTLYITSEAMKRIRYYTEAADGEVSGLGTIRRGANGHQIVDKVYLLEQKSSSGDTEIDTEAISKLMVTMMEENRDPSILKFWWHSHDNMGVFWSGTDDTCAETLSHEFAFSLVVNKRGEKKCRLDLYQPFRITIDNLHVQELVEEDTILKEECKKEVEEKVKSFHSYTPSGGQWNQGHGYSGIGFGNSWNKNRTSNLDVKEGVAESIKKLLSIAKDNSSDGGIFFKGTWEEFIHDTLSTIVDKRFNDKASCQSFGTYEGDLPLCKKCKASKHCQVWTNRLIELAPKDKDIPDSWIETETFGQETLEDYNEEETVIINGEVT